MSHNINAGLLIPVKGGEIVLRFTATFGKDKRVQLNQFLGKTYIHLSSPSNHEEDDAPKRRFSMSTDDFKQALWDTKQRKRG